MANFMCFSSSTKRLPRGNLILFILTLLRWWQQKEWMAHPLNCGCKPAAQVEGRSSTVSSSVQCMHHSCAIINHSSYSCGWKGVVRVSYGPKRQLIALFWPVKHEKYIFCIYFPYPPQREECNKLHKVYSIHANKYIVKKKIN